MRFATWWAAVVGLGCSSPHLDLALRDMPLHQPVECRLEGPITLGPTDVAIVIDRSRPTIDPTGSDIDGDGRVGRTGFRLATGSAEAADNYLTAQVVAARSLVRTVVDVDVRLAIVAFTGPSRSAALGDRWEAEGVRQFGEVWADLTSDPKALEAALEALLRREPERMASFAAGMTRALDVLASAPNQDRRPRKVVVFMAASPEPRAGKAAEPAMKDAARLAIDKGVVFNTFGLGEAAAASTPTSLSRIAGATGGHYRPVSDPSTLYCHLLESVVL